MNENHNKESNKRAIAKFDYNGSEIQNNLLSFKKGDLLELLETNETNWWKAKDSNGTIALIPANYVKEIEEDLNDSTENMNINVDPNRPLKKVIKINMNLLKKTPPNEPAPLSPKPKKSPPKPPQDDNNSEVINESIENGNGNMNISPQIQDKTGIPTKNNILNKNLKQVKDTSPLNPPKKVINPNLPQNTSTTNITGENLNVVKDPSSPGVKSPMKNNGVIKNPNKNPLKNPNKNPGSGSPINKNAIPVKNPHKNTPNVNPNYPHTPPPSPPHSPKEERKTSPLKNNINNSNNNLLIDNNSNKQNNKDNGVNNINDNGIGEKKLPPVPTPPLKTGNSSNDLKNLPPVPTPPSRGNSSNDLKNLPPVPTPPIKNILNISNNNLLNEQNLPPPIKINIGNQNNNNPTNIPPPITNIPPPITNIPPPITNIPPPITNIPSPIPSPIQRNTDTQIITESDTNTSQKEMSISEDEVTISENSIEIELSEQEKKLLKMKKQLDSILNEIQQSERAFCKDVEILIQMYKTPLESEIKLISSKDITSIFANINQIHGINEELLKELEKEKSPKNVSAAFVKMAEYLKVYSIYCANQDLSLSTVESLMEKNKEFKSFLLENESKFLSRGLPLKAFLIKPVQRICKYPLLLRELIRSLEPSEPAREDLEKVSIQIENVVKHINDKRRLQEGLKGVIDVSEKLVGFKNIVKKSRLFIFGGNEVTFSEVFRIKKDDGEGGIKKEVKHKEGRMIFLFNDMVLLCKPEKKKGKLKVMEKIKISNLRVEDYDKHEPNEIKVRTLETEKQTYRWVFQCRDNFIKINWMEKFESVGAKKKPRDLEKLEVFNTDMELENLKIKIQKIEQSFIDIEKATLLLQKRIEKSEQIEATSEKAAKNSLEKFQTLKCPTASFFYQAKELRFDVIEANKLFEIVQKKSSELSTQNTNQSIFNSVDDICIGQSKEEPAPKKTPHKIGNYNSSTLTSSMQNVNNRPEPPNGKFNKTPKKIVNKKLNLGGSENTSRQRSGTSGNIVAVKKPNSGLSSCEESLKNMDVKSVNFLEQMTKYKKNVRVKIVILDKLVKQLANM
eukprot:TRINITY_DN1678_c0_g1_i1.p1 TRINITY_DN1678_c0_g1~~TRINITY_DN1678_c0_g1_i1.p1  ORF type:complete len:1073 (+),score=394.17 TRINITY_DN1678_c0_g1_i1:63-3281(+)